MVGGGHFLLIRLVVLIRLVFRAVLVVLGVFHPSYFSRPSRPRGLGWLERAIGLGLRLVWGCSLTTANQSGAASVLSERATRYGYIWWRE